MAHPERVLEVLHFLEARKVEQEGRSSKFISLETVDQHTLKDATASSSKAVRAKPAEPRPVTPQGTGGSRPVTPQGPARSDTRPLIERLREIVSPADPTKLYERVRKAGEGASGVVYIARHVTTKALVAIKQMRFASQPNKELIISEILIMRAFRHPNIVNYVDSFLITLQPGKEELWV